MANYASWYAVATGANANATLASITDASYAGDPAGTDCDSTYWESRAYDQIRALYVAIGSNPGSGVDGAFTLNQDNTSNDAEDAVLNFSRGSAIGGDATIRWDASETYFLLNQALTSQNDIGTSGVPIPKVWATDTDIAGTLDGTNADFTGTLDVDGLATLTTLTVTGTTTLNTLSLGGNLGFDGTVLTMNEDYTGGSPTENASIVVERGTVANAVLRWNETNDEWEAYNLGAAAYNTLALFDSNGFTDAGVFAGTGGDYGTANYAARSDHNHTGGSLNATGTDETTWRVDEDYTSGSVNIEVQFGSAGDYIRYNPGGNDHFEFSGTVASDTNNTDDLGTASLKWRDLRLGRDAYIDGDLTLTGDVTGSLTQKGQIFTFFTDAAARTLDADIVADRGTNADTRLRWDESETKWMFTNDGTNYYYFVGADDGDDTFTTPGDLAVGGSITGNLTMSGTSHTLGALGNNLTIQKPRATFNAKLQYTDGSNVWQIDHGTGTLRTIATLNGTETLTAKTLTSPSITSPTITSSGSWAGAPTFSGNAVFTANPSFTGNPNFTADTDSRPVFTTTANYAPFTVTVSGGAAATVTNLDADKLDGYHSTSYMLLNGSQAMTGDLDLGGNNIIGAGNLDHKTSHQRGGDDTFDGILGTATGTDNVYWRIGSASAAATNLTLYLSQSNDYWFGIKSTSPKAIGIGSQGVHLSPGGTSLNQDIGQSTQRWRGAWFDQHVNINLKASAPAELVNGSLWMQSGSPQKLYAYLDGASVKVIDGNGYTGATNTDGNLTVNGDLTVTGSLSATVGAHVHSTADITSGVAFGIAYGGTNNSGTYTTDKFLKYNGSSIASTIYDENSFATAGHNHNSDYSALGHTHAASEIDSGTLSLVRGGTNYNAWGAGDDSKILIYNNANNRIEPSGSTTSSFATSGHNHDASYANITHNHSATEITSGKLAILRGGTNNDSYTAGQFVAYDTPTDSLKSSGYSFASFATAGHNHNSDYSALGHTHPASEITSGELSVARGGTNYGSWGAGDNGKLAVYSHSNSRIEPSSVVAANIAMTTGATFTGDFGSTNGSRLDLLGGSSTVNFAMEAGAFALFNAGGGNSNTGFVTSTPTGSTLHFYVAGYYPASMTYNTLDLNGTDLKMDMGKKITLDDNAGSNTYFYFSNTGGGPTGTEGRIVFFVDGTEVGQIDSQGFTT